MRNIKIDILKGFAIILVVIGHNIQFMKGSEYAQGAFYSNPVFSLIYTFHMPLFMLISGYLFNNAIEKYPTKKIIIKKFTSLIMPILIWTLLIKILLSIFSGVSFSLIQYILEVLRSLWFLWAVFYCSFGALIGNRFFKDNPLFHLLVLIVLMFTPSILNKDLYAFMYPYFILGYYAKKYSFNIRNVGFLLMSILYSALLCLWGTDKYVYTTGVTLYGEVNPITHLYIDIYRWVIGVLGSVLIIKLVDILYEKYGRGFSLLIYIGKNSLGIYILNTYISHFILPRINLLYSWNEISYTLTAIFLSAVVLAFSLVILNLLKKVDILKFIFLGEKGKEIDGFRSDKIQFYG